MTTPTLSSSDVRWADANGWRLAEGGNKRQKWRHSIIAEIKVGSPVEVAAKHSLARPRHDKHEARILAQIGQILSASDLAYPKNRFFPQDAGFSLREPCFNRACGGHRVAWERTVQGRRLRAVIIKFKLLPLGSTKDSRRRDEGGQGITEVCRDASRGLGIGRKGPSRRRRRGVSQGRHSCADVMATGVCIATSAHVSQGPQALSPGPRNADIRRYIEEFRLGTERVQGPISEEVLLRRYGVDTEFRSFNNGVATALFMWVHFMPPAADPSDAESDSAGTVKRTWVDASLGSESCSGNRSLRTHTCNSGLRAVEVKFKVEKEQE
ncbi:hypothetical protein DFH09DRAFT_1103214 [Mycena vulgaris]|nr:hypothetical protein DFH09DRAFT_1103214 [Mycena vulgaris]